MSDFVGLVSGKDLQEQLKMNQLRLTGQKGSKNSHAVLKKQFVLPALTGTTATDIQNLHTTLQKVINHLWSD